MKKSKAFTALLIVLILSVPVNTVWAAPKASVKNRPTKKSSKTIEIYASNIGNPQDLLQKGNAKDVDETVESIERVIDWTNLSNKSYECNQEIFVATNGEARVVKCHFDNPDTVPPCEELNKLMKKYGYPEYSLDVYYDNPEAGEEFINNGPICIKGYIGDDFYTYYFKDNALIRRVKGDTTSDNIKTNDFLGGIYKIAWKYQEIENPEGLSITDVPRTDDDSYMTTDDSLTECLSQNYKHLKKAFGANKDYKKVKADLVENPFWFYDLVYDDTDFLLYSDNDKVFCLYSSAENFWDIPDDGINVWELVDRTDAEINDIYVEECLGDLFVGNEGDNIISLVIDDNLFSIVVYNGRIMPDSTVQVWPITY